MKRKFYLLLTVLLGTFATDVMADNVVYNATKQTGYETLSAALADLDADATENVLELNEDVTLDGRTAPGNGKILTIKPMKDGITLRRGSLKGNSIWFLTNNASQTLNIGCDEYQLIIDGEGKTDNTNCLLGCEKGAMNVTNVKFTNFNYGESGALNKTGNNNLTLKNVTVEDSQTGTQFFQCSGKDKLILDGSLNFNNCTGNHIMVNERIALLNGADFTATTPVILQLKDTFAEGSLVIKCNNGAGANAAAKYFTIADNKFSIVQGTGSHNYELILGTADGISNVKVANSESKEYYDLQGRRVANPTKGIYIVNDKKVIIK